MANEELISYQALSATFEYTVTPPPPMLAEDGAQLLTEGGDDIVLEN